MGKGPFKMKGHTLPGIKQAPTKFGIGAIGAIGAAIGKKRPTQTQTQTQTQSRPTTAIMGAIRPTTKTSSKTRGTKVRSTISKAASSLWGRRGKAATSSKQPSARVVSRASDKMKAQGGSTTSRGRKRTISKPFASGAVVASMPRGSKQSSGSSRSRSIKTRLKSLVRPIWI